LNRDIYGKPSGVRMHALVALGAAQLTENATPGPRLQASEGTVAC